MEIYFATNRDQQGPDRRPKFGNRFNAMGPQFFRVGRAELERVPNEGFRVTSVELEPERLIKSPRDKTERLGSRALFDELRNKMRQENRDVLIFLHGFANTFESCLERGAQLKERYLVRGAEPHVFVFSWPSDGKTFPVTAYHDDRSDAAASGEAMARALAKLLDFLRQGGERCGCRIHLVAHSMGNWALRHAVLGIRAHLATDRLPQIFDNVFLMAADEDDDAFEHDHKLKLLPQLSRAVHVYHSRNDQALLISDTTKNNPDRLGARGPRRIEGLDTKVFLVDCQHVDETTTEDARHQYYRERAEVLRDVRQVLDDVPPDEVVGRRPTGAPRSFRILAEGA
jgi:esterase/lipase superfamily enzyme